MTGNVFLAICAPRLDSQICCLFHLALPFTLVARCAGDAGTLVDHCAGPIMPVVVSLRTATGSKPVFGVADDLTGRFKLRSAIRPSNRDAGRLAGRRWN